MFLTYPIMIGYQPAELRLVFRISGRGASTTFAYVLWFSRMSASPDATTGLRHVMKLFFRSKHAGGIIRLDNIVGLCQLAPDLPSTLRKGEFTPYNSMDNVTRFWVNKYASHADYAMLS